jgi:mono/diheme cytochrome c family protein/glucose/arabinose dehydrogenase
LFLKMSKIKAMRNCIMIFSLLVVWSCGEKEYKDEIYEKPEIVKEAPSDYLSPEEAMKKFYLPEGYRIELVASEPMVREPVAIAWDGDGKMYVAQLDTYMQDIDGTGTDEPVSQIKLLEDLDGDGKMDKSTVFIDSLVLPRMILPLDDRLIVNETYSYDLWSYRDTDGDGVADEKINIYSNPNRRGGNLEHQQSGLIWNIDNWLYMTTQSYRLRFTTGKLEIDTLENYPGGQWGLTQDDMGVMYFGSAGGENPAYGFQQPAVYGHVNLPGRLSERFIEPWPIVGNPDVQGGMAHRNKEDGTLNHFTGVAGQAIFRGDKLPPSAKGDLFIPEPVGRLIRRAKVKNEDGKKVLYNAYDEAEFLASTDLNFRPVQAQTGPDGCLYIVDMYRGIIQESNWTREGSKIRPHIVRKGLDKNFGKGRIYRIVHEQIEPGGKPNLLSKSADELLEYLEHPNGWYRNTAQKLIILKGDKSVVPALKEMAKDNVPFWSGLTGDKDYALGRIHALWTLEGLGVVDKSLIGEKLKDEDARVRVMAIRLSDELLKSGDKDLLPALAQLQSDTDINVINQLALSMRYSASSQATDVLNAISAKYADNEVISRSVFESLKKDDSELQVLKKRISNRGGDKNRILKGYDIYKQLCITCHGPDLKGVPTGSSLIAPSLIGSPRVIGDKDVLLRILINGLIGPVDGKDYGIMMPMGDNDNNWLADVASYIRTMNDTTMVNGREVRNVRAKYKDRDSYWTMKELME